MMQEMEEDEIARGNLKMPEDLRDDDSALDDYDDEEEGEGVFGQDNEGSFPSDGMEEEEQAPEEAEEDQDKAVEQLFKDADEEGEMKYVNQDLVDKIE